MEYEEHLRNTLKKGMDAESYSLHTFEALLTQSMENLGQSSSAFLWILKCCNAVGVFRYCSVLSGFRLF